jgi:hypothetical protein
MMHIAFPEYIRMSLCKSLLFIILILAAGCQSSSSTLDRIPTLSPTPQPLAINRPTRTPRPIQAAPTLTATFVPTHTPPHFSAPTQPPVADLPTVPPTAVAGTPIGTPVPTLPPAAETFVIGQSAQGRDILAWRIGTGSKVLLLVGGVHTGFESNTVLLLNEMIRYFESAPADVLPGLSLVLIPVLNPDGLMLGRVSAGRFNGNGVDLNRNWGCEWSENAYWRDQLVNPGSRPFSEPESRALAEWIRNTRPAAAIFYHSAAAGVFAGDCEGQGVSTVFAAVLGEATGYAYGQPFTAYPVTGTASSWIDELGIPSVDLELSGTRESEFARNRLGVIAAQCWLIDPVQTPSIPICSA